MSRRAASIEPEDGECTPSPVAAEQSSEMHRHAQMGQVPTQPMEAASQLDSLPPPPAVPGPSQQVPPVLETKVFSVNICSICVFDDLLV